MSCKQRRDHITLFSFIATFCLFTFQVSHSVSFGQRKEGLPAYQVHDNDQQQGPGLPRSNPPDLTELRPESVSSLGEPDPHVSAPTRHDHLFRTIGHIRPVERTSTSVPKKEYQADFTGFHVQGKVSGPTSSPYFSTWLAMSPLVKCDDGVMTFTATGEEFTHLLVDRGTASPISLSQLPSYCGYLVKMSWSDLEMMVPYDACYITQENGSYVLPMLWWGSPLKLSCPVQASSPVPSSSHSAPRMFCSPYGMALQMQEQDIQLLGVLVNGGWGPFVSPECAYRVSSSPGNLAFFISYSAACITHSGGIHLQFVLDDQTYILSCPVNPQFPYNPDTVSPAPSTPPPSTTTTTTPPQPTTQEHFAQLPHFPNYPYPGFQYLQFPQVFPSGPQPAHTPHPTSPPATHPPKHPASLYYPEYYLQMPYYPEPTAAPVTQAPAPLTPSPLSPKQPAGPQYPVYPFYHPTYFNLFNHGLFSNPGVGVQPAPTSQPAITTPSPVPPTITRTMVPKQPDLPSYPFYQSYPKQTIHFPHITAPPHAKEMAQTVTQETPTPTIQPNTHTMCVHPPHPYYPNYHPLYPPHNLPSYPHHPVTHPPTTTTSTTTIPTTPTYTSDPVSPTAAPTPQHPHFRCLMGAIVVFLPFAHLESIQVRDEMMTWLLVSSVSRVCRYMLQRAEGSGVFLHSPLPACHSQQSTPTNISLPLRFWDLSMGQYRTLDLQCPYQTAPPAVVTPSVFPTPASTPTAKVSPTLVVPKPKVFCSSYQMAVELAPGPISEILVKDIKGNQMILQDVPKDCGYSARKGKDGKNLLSLELHSRCYMSVQGKLYIITVVYVTLNGRRKARLSCPVVISRSGQECNLPIEQRLPCGPRSVSQGQCLSVGCCFSKLPPACYYPMDECTIDRHFVFSVPASLTDPPLSPTMLVAAGNSTCKPERVTSDYALFKIPMDGCGTRRLMAGKTVIYMLEIINKVQALSLNYGTITRDSPVRLLVECRFLPGTVLSVSYLVKTPTLGSEVQTQGMFGVQLRIAKDAQYSSFHPQYHQPLQMLLGKPLYLEVRLLNAPDPSLVLLVNFCVAYPRSGKAVWMLLYNGCPNPLDPALQQVVLSDPRPPSPQAQTRHFTISTFQFLPDGDFKDPDEEIYFMCSTEICSPRDGPCVEGCFGQ
ncbi:hypothetical protein CesoFtcFv8_008946 [Champsocephalus esox]|uniref:Zona pellucida sperm-binding protein 4-like n=2 Tax=Champsocephalus TaxID=52236 RepID=A0AAN8H1V6_9TELE|nr:hypothetical protein CesoFtcFv8_008946 [Champsocephalus esox]